MAKRKHKISGFTITELITLLILIALFYFGFKGGSGLVLKLTESRSISVILLALASGILGGALPVLAFVFSCIGIGTYMEKRKKKKTKKSSDVR